MGTVSEMKSTINVDNDSDCEIQTSDITIITINDSIDDLEREQQQQSTVELEEGEVCEETALHSDNLFEIHFFNKDAFEKYGAILDRIIQEKLLQESDEKIKCCIETTPDKAMHGLKKIIYKKQQQLQEHQEKSFVIERKSSQSKEIQRKINDRRQRDLIKEQSPDLSGIDNLFVLDKEPNEKLDFLSVPSYKRSYKDALGDSVGEKRKKREKMQFSRRKVKRACFNCGDTGHSLRECVLPRKHKRIRNAMKAIKKHVRYHSNVDQKFSYIEPGNVSDALKEAMGLRKGELPFFFYRMRVLGYPPGWLENAKVPRSDMTIYNADGSRVLASDEEEGEIYGLSYKYNATKIIDFPGFNKYAGDNFYDDYKYYNVPRFSKRQSKENFIKSLGDAVFYGYKRRKLKDLPSCNTSDESKDNTSTLVLEDMEIEDVDDSLVKEELFLQPPLPPEKPPNDQKPPLPAQLLSTTSAPSPHIDGANIICINLCDDSDTDIEEKGLNCSAMDSSTLNLSALEAKQQKLLKELEVNTTIQDASTSTSNENSLINDSLTKEEIYEQQQQQQKQDNENEPAIVKTVETQGAVTECYLGTPILKFSEYDRLPSSENFRKGISDVINYENLPSSTGKYEEMKKILKKVKDTMQKLQQEDERRG